MLNTEIEPPLYNYVPIYTNNVEDFNNNITYPLYTNTENINNSYLEDDFHNDVTYPFYTNTKNVNNDNIVVPWNKIGCFFVIIFIMLIFGWDIYYIISKVYNP